MILFFKSKNPEKEIESLDKTLEMLKKRYERKEISLTDFSKQGKKIGKKKRRLLKQIKY